MGVQLVASRVGLQQYLSMVFLADNPVGEPGSKAQEWRKPNI